MQQLQAYLQHHPQMLYFSLAKLLANPLASLMTIAVIGISIALPTASYVLLANAQTAISDWDANARISLYLNELSGADTDALLEQVQAQPGIASVAYLSPDSALAEFREISGFGDALDALEENPLPGVIVVEPQAGLSAERLQTLADSLSALTGVDLAQLDVEWVKRLHAILRIIRRSVTALAALLSLAVLLVVGNTIRLDILNRRAEIEVTKLIGATDGFIRRPFLYGGIWYGLLGGALALVLSGAALLLLREPVAQLSSLYGSAFRLRMFDWQLAVLVLGGAATLGWLGSWLAVGRHLKRIEPS
jgi:cell division transport system permease protein